MKRNVIIALAMSLLLFAGSASANSIGIFADMDASLCAADLNAYVPTNVFVIGVLSDLTSITTAEFKIDNWPGSPGYPTGQVTATWTSELTIGSIDTDFSIAWQTPQPGPLVLIGTLEFLVFDPAWIPADYAMEVVAGDNCSCLVMVDANYDTHDVAGGGFIFNCTAECDCAVATEESSWSGIKALY